MQLGRRVEGSQAGVTLEHDAQESRLVALPVHDLFPEVKWKRNVITVWHAIC